MTTFPRLTNRRVIADDDKIATTQFSRAWDQLATAVEGFTEAIPVDTALVTITRYLPVTLPDGSIVKLAILA